MRTIRGSSDLRGDGMTYYIGMSRATVLLQRIAACTPVIRSISLADVRKQQSEFIQTGTGQSLQGLVRNERSNTMLQLGHTFNAGIESADLNTSMRAAPRAPSAVVTLRPNEYVDPSSRLVLGSVTRKSFAETTCGWRRSEQGCKGLDFVLTNYITIVCGA